METKENLHVESNSSGRVKELTDSGAPSLKERMRRLAQQQKAWENDEDAPSPLVNSNRRERASRPSINPASGQVTHLKARFQKLAEEISEREDDQRPVRRDLPPLSLHQTSPVRKRWQPPQPLAGTLETPPPLPMPPGAPNLRSRSPSPSRAEMPCSPRGGAQGSVERPRPVSVSARKASWENAISRSRLESENSSKSPALLDLKTCSRTPPLPREHKLLDAKSAIPPTPPKRTTSAEPVVSSHIVEKQFLTPSEPFERSSSAQRAPITPSVSSESLASSERSARKESLRKQKERQQHMKYEAGLAAIGFDVEQTEEKNPPPSDNRPSLHRTNETAFKRPATSSLLSIISSSSSERNAESRPCGLDAEKRAKMLTFISDTQLPFTSAAVDKAEGETEAEEEEEELEVISDVDTAESETNSLFSEKQTTPEEKVVFYMNSMRRAERRASMNETVTVVTTESELDEDAEEEFEESCSTTEESGESLPRPSVQEQQFERHDQETKSKLLAFMETRRPSQTSLCQAAKPPIPSKVNVSQLLDEAMASLDSSVIEEVAEDHEITNVTDLSAFTPLREQSPRPLRRGRRSNSWSDLRSPCLNAQAALSPPVDPDLPGDLAYSVKTYRFIEDQRKKSPPAARIYSLDFEDRSGESTRNAELPSQPAADAKLLAHLAPRDADSKRLQSMQQLAQQQEAVIMQASKALHEVLSNGMSGSAQHVECSRVLVVACQKRQAYLEECSRLRAGRALSSAGSGTSSVLTLSGVRLALKAAYLQRIRQQQQIVQHGGGTAIEQHHFLCMLRLQDGRMHATEVTSTGTNFGPTARDFVEIPTCLTVKDLPQGWVASLDVFGFSLTRDSEPPATSPQTRTPSQDHTPRRLLQRLRSGRTPSSAKASRGSSNNAGSSGARGWTPHGGFTHLSSVRLTADSIGQSVFPLLRLPALSPLEGILQVRLRLSSEPRIEHRGFVNVFAEVGGFGSWFRRWCSLQRDQLLLWNYPEEEARGGAALACLSLRHCLTRRVEPLSREQCARPNTMQLQLLRPTAPGENDNLVLRRRGDLVLEKVMLSAESRKEMIEWSDRLNECLFMLRQWHADQYRQLEARARVFTQP